MAGVVGGTFRNVKQGDKNGYAGGYEGNTRGRDDAG